MSDLKPVGGLVPISLRELVGDFFGILIPGMVYSVMVALLMWVSAQSVLSMFSHFDPGVRVAPVTAPPAPAGDGDRHGVHFLQPEWADFLGAIRLELFLFMSVFSYTVGHIFYRMGAKEPEESSVRRVLRLLKKNDKPWVVEKNGNTQYPYTALRAYLTKRKLTHLIRLVPWPGQKSGSMDSCSQHYMRILHLRVKFFSPEKCWEIDRNEAQLRLMSSTWYLARSLRNISAIVAVPALVNLTLGFTGTSWKGGEYLHEASVHVLPLLVVIVIASSSWHAKKKIEEFLHLQRVWKVIALLETAFLVSQQEESFFEGLDPAGLEEQVL